MRITDERAIEVLNDTAANLEESADQLERADRGLQPPYQAGVKRQNLVS
jgi:hypothetical protein